MAIQTPNGPKANTGERKQIKTFLKSLLPNPLVRAIDILLHPCCDPGITLTSITCATATTVDMVFNVANPFSPEVFPLSVVQVLSTDGNVGSGTISADGTTITVPGMTITMNALLLLEVIIFYTTGFTAIGGTTGTFAESVIGPITTPNCAPSDRRIKENITKIGVSGKGINIYTFNFKSDPHKIVYQGVIAQELIGTADQNAVIGGPILLVDYSKTDVTFQVYNPG